jgi:hypothetical protein
MEKCEWVRVSPYEASIRDTIRVWYDTDTLIRVNFKKSISDTGAIRYLKINLKIEYKNARYINMTKINNINNDIFFLEDKNYYYYYYYYKRQ